MEKKQTQKEAAGKKSARVFVENPLNIKEGLALQSRTFKNNANISTAMLAEEVVAEQPAAARGLCLETDFR